MFWQTDAYRRGLSNSLTRPQYGVVRVSQQKPYRIAGQGWAAV